MIDKCGLKADLSNYKSVKSKYYFNSVCPQGMDWHTSLHASVLSSNTRKSFTYNSHSPTNLQELDLTEKTPLWLV